MVWAWGMVGWGGSGHSDTWGSALTQLLCLLSWPLAFVHQEAPAAAAAVAPGGQVQTWAAWPGFL